MTFPVLWCVCVGGGWGGSGQLCEKQDTAVGKELGGQNSGRHRFRWSAGGVGGCVSIGTYKMSLCHTCCLRLGRTFSLLQEVHPARCPPCPCQCGLSDAPCPDPSLGARALPESTATTSCLTGVCVCVCPTHSDPVTQTHNPLQSEICIHKICLFCHWFSVGTFEFPHCVICVPLLWSGAAHAGSRFTYLNNNDDNYIKQQPTNIFQASVLTF